MSSGLIISFFSASGGAGKTVTALHSAKLLHLSGKKVLYMSLDSSPVPISAAQNRYWPKFFFEITSDDLILDPADPVYQELSDTYIFSGDGRLGGLPVLLPSEEELLHWHDCIRDLNDEDVARLFSFARSKYDYVVIDIDSNLAPSTFGALTESDMIFWLLCPDYATLAKAATIYYAHFSHDKSPVPRLKECLDSIRFICNRSVFLDERVSPDNQEKWKQTYIRMFSEEIPGKIARNEYQNDLTIHGFLPYISRWKDVMSFDEWFATKDPQFQFMIDLFTKHVQTILRENGVLA
jgi:cellulose biosynthesis protein BcsQ